MKVKILLACALLFTAFTANAQSKLSPSTRIFVENAKEATTTDAVKCMSKSFPISRASNNVDYVNAFIYLAKDANIANLENAGVIVEADFNGIVTAKIPMNSLETIAELSDITYIEVGTNVSTKMNNARPASRVTEAHAGTGLSRPFYGEGVVLGIVDYGMQYDHINFFNMGGTELRLKRVWNQNRSGNPPSGFSSGYEYADSTSICAARFDDRNDDVGHATHVMGIAAGADTINGNQYYGVAPKSDLVFVSYSATDASTDNVSISNGVKYIFDYATSVNKPAVVNLSLGSHIGPHDGTSTFDRLIDQMTLAAPGRIVVGSAGNEGYDGLHLKKTFTATSTEVKTSLSFVTYYGILYGTVDIWGDVTTDYNVRVSVVQKSSLEEISTSGDINALTTTTKTYRPTTGASGSVYIASGLESNNKGHVQIEFQLNSVSSGNYMGIIISGVEGGVVNAWADGSFCTFAKNGLTGFVAGNNNSSVGEISGVGTNIITVGAYATTNHYYESVGGIASFSSMGPTADGRIKPDVAAPGTGIISSVPNTTAIKNGSAYDAAGQNVVNGNTYLYGWMQGTSMSSPYAAGVIALWLEANPNMGPSRIREILEATSIQDNNTGSNLPNNTWGYGKINAVDGILKAIEISDVKQLETLPDAIIAYPNPSDGNFKILFTQNDPSMTINVYNISGQVVYS
ncbi:MAG: S8 family peptidase, partial [Bacteroidales bacterium]|nr:S8 family peptidase [Bacteroidales bacterium]